MADSKAATIDYLQRHDLRAWFQAKLEALIVSRPDDPMVHLQEMLAEEIRIRRELNSNKNEVEAEGVLNSREEAKRGDPHEGSIQVTARVSIKRGDGVRHSLSFDKTASSNMIRGTKGALMIR